MRKGRAAWLPSVSGLMPALRSGRGRRRRRPYGRCPRRRRAHRRSGTRRRTDRRRPGYHLDPGGPLGQAECLHLMLVLVGPERRHPPEWRAIRLPAGDQVGQRAAGPAPGIARHAPVLDPSGPWRPSPANGMRAMSPAATHRGPAGPRGAVDLHGGVHHDPVGEVQPVAGEPLGVGNRSDGLDEDGRGQVRAVAELHGRDAVAAARGAAPSSESTVRPRRKWTPWAS